MAEVAKAEVAKAALAAVAAAGGREEPMPQ
jgi:hypothetical protein